MKKVLITGVTGQVGSIMADYLLNNTEHTIIGGARRLSVKNHKNISHLKCNDRFRLIDLDITDHQNISRVIEEEKPDYFINFAANSFVGTSWKMPVNHMQTNCMSVLYQLESIAKHSPNCRYYNAGSSEEFGDVIYSPQDEKHPARPQSPYGASKSSARNIVRVYRESYNLYAIQGWLFNHEGTRRGLDFVTRKISHGVAKLRHALDIDQFIKRGKPELPVLELGNLDAKRDWSDAEDFVEAVWAMLNQDKPKEYVLASGKMHTVRDFLKFCLEAAAIKHKITGSGKSEKLTLEDGRIIAKVNPEFYRPAEVHKLCGDPSKAEKDLKWNRKSDVKSMAYKMVKNDIETLNRSCKT